MTQKFDTAAYIPCFHLHACHRCETFGTTSSWQKPAGRMWINTVHLSSLEMAKCTSALLTTKTP